MVVPPDNVLTGVMGEASQVVTIHFDHEGKLHIGGSHGTEQSLLMIKLAEHDIITTCYEQC